MNILLHANFIAQLCEFGLSKLIDKGKSNVVTNMKGTPGYVASKWLLQAVVTRKSDVYIYGMVLLELVSGQRNLDLSCQMVFFGMGDDDGEGGEDNGDSGQEGA
ncbi:hypothetical protein L7F22_029295 [Adiantum nelumboides]|nr:hypothetical protein [Adiantum nelumboides]